MDDIVYSSNPNEDSAQVKVEGKFHKASLVRSVGDSEIIYQDNVNVDKVLFTGEDGKKHTAGLIKDIGNAEVIYENNPSIGKVLFTGDDGKKHTATLVKNIVGGGSTPVIDTLNVTPTTSAQTITAPSGTDGYSPVNVAAVTSAIDANIVAGNIKKDVEILGVTGSYEGQTPTGTKSITANGVYDVTDFASADVQVSSSAPAHYVEKIVVDGKLRNGSTVINLNGVTDVGDYVLMRAYNTVSFPANTSVDFSGLTTLSGASACQYMFQSCSGITSVDLSSLTTITGQYACGSMFGYCTGITSVDLSALTTLSGPGACDNMFIDCADLTSVDLSSLTTVSGNQALAGMFSTCASLTTAKFNALNVITAQLARSYGQVFTACTRLESVTFGGLKASTFASKKDQFAYLFNASTGSSATGGCTVHFPSNFDPSDPSHTFDASTLTGYPTFGGSASYIHVAFDLPATES